MSDTSQPTPSKGTDRAVESQREKQERDHVCKLPDDEEIPPDQERGERTGTAKAIATGGKSDEACEQPGGPSQETPSKSP